MHLTLHFRVKFQNTVSFPKIDIIKGSDNVKEEAIHQKRQFQKASFQKGLLAIACHTTQGLLPEERKQLC